jgi:RNA-directed DNA polymerase
MKKKGYKETAMPLSRSVLEMTHDEARAFFLKPDSYCTLDLPPYFVFKELLEDLGKYLKTNPLNEHRKNKPCNVDGVNHVILSNKDGKYAWRPLQLCHPAIYVQLVCDMTTAEHWRTIKDSFNGFFANSKLQCLSVPVESLSSQSDRAEQVIRWWHEIEQRSIELALDYEVLAHADIADCYGSLYTHSISWGLHTKTVSKAKKKDFKLIGNLIDARIQDMSNGQTNGIPQGSVLMDFIAEIVLGFADTLITQKISDTGISDYHILRYRDDYRVFAMNSQAAEQILKCVSEALATLGLKLNTSKTVVSQEIITDSMKRDKLAWLSSVQRHRNLEKHLLLIHRHATAFPSSATLVRALHEYHRRIVGIKKISSDIIPLISILVDIACHSPKVYSVTMAILSKLLTFIGDTNDKRAILRRVHLKFTRIPNTGHLSLWLQRVFLPIGEIQEFVEPLCQVAAGKDIELWNSSWISSPALLKMLKSNRIIDTKVRDQLSTVISADEVQLFERSY